MAFAYTKVKKVSLGNRAGYIYNMTAVATSGSILYTPFKKITGYVFNTTNPATSFITVATNNEKSASATASLEFAADAETTAQVLVWGLL